MKKFDEILARLRLSIAVIVIAQVYLAGYACPSFEEERNLR